MGKPNKIVFKSKIKEFRDGEEVEKEVSLAVRPPTAAEKQKAKLVHGKAYADAVNAKLLLREELDQHLRQKSMWDDDKEANFQEIKKFLLESELKIARADCTIEEARDIALQMGDKRLEMNDLLTDRNRIDRNTADAHADDMQFNFLVACCTVFNDTGKPFFTYDGEHASMDAYIEKGTEEVAIESANKMSEIINGSPNEFLAKLPENQFLKEYGFVDDDFHLVNEEGKRIDRKGRLVNEAGRYINEKGEYIDSDGNRVDEEGKYVVEKKQFKDKDGNVVLPKGQRGHTALPVPIPPAEGEEQNEAA
jgi:hypothetical protein